MRTTYKDYEVGGVRAMVVVAMYAYLNDKTVLFGGTQEKFTLGLCRQIFIIESFIMPCNPRRGLYRSIVNPPRKVALGRRELERAIRENNINAFALLAFWLPKYNPNATHNDDADRAMAEEIGLFSVFRGGS